jgi:hypothetical protein
MADRWKSLSDWFTDWTVDIHPDVYLRDLEISDAALLTTERMNMILFDDPTTLHVPVSYYCDHKRRLVVHGTTLF